MPFFNHDLKIAPFSDSRPRASAMTGHVHQNKHVVQRNLPENHSPTSCVFVCLGFPLCSCICETYLMICSWRRTPALTNCLPLMWTSPPVEGWNNEGVAAAGGSRPTPGFCVLFVARCIKPVLVQIISTRQTVDSCNCSCCTRSED